MLLSGQTIITHAAFDDNICFTRINNWKMRPSEELLINRFHEQENKWLPFVWGVIHATYPVQRDMKALLPEHRQSSACFRYFLSKSQLSRNGRKKKSSLSDRHQSSCNLPHQSEAPSIWCTGFANEQALRAGVFFLPLPLPTRSFFHLTPTPSANISSPQSSTVTKSKMKP